MLYSATVLVVMLLLLFLTGFSAAQESDASDTGTDTTPDWVQTTEELPDTNPDWIRPGAEIPQFVPLDQQTIAVLRGQAFSLDPDSKTRVLRTIADMATEGLVSPYDEDAVEVVGFLATESYDFQVIRLGQTINDFPLVRAEAVRLLGGIGGPVAAVALERVLRQETDFYVLSEAVRAVGISAQTATPELLALLTGLTVRMENLQRPDNALAMAVLNTVDKLQSVGDPIDDPDLFRALIQIAQGPYSNTVRREALNLVNKLRRREQ